jgi:hypothetical protein
MSNEYSATISITFDVDVWYRLEVDESYGADADGNRGVRSVERVIERVELFEDVPEPVAGYLKALAIEKVEAMP